MEPILTRYLYPIGERIPLVSNYGIAFDNPRNPDEIAKMEQLLKTAIPDGHSLLSILNLKNVPSGKMPEEFYSLQATVTYLLESLSKNSSYVQKFILDNRNGDPFNVLARMWVWVTVNEKYMTKDHLTDELPVEKYDVYTQNDSREYIIESRIYELSYFASLLTSCGAYWERASFLRMRYPNDNNFDIGNILFSYRLSSIPGLMDKGIKPMSLFQEDLEGLLDVFTKIDQWLSGKDHELILYLSNLIHASTNYTLTEKARLILLVSAIELMLTHNPNFNRFNVEDSIGKQFVLKMAVVMHQYDPAQDIKKLQETIRHTYNIRSKIAHGDYAGLRKAICKRLSRSDYSLHMEEYHISTLNETMYMYIGIIMNQYFDYPDFLKFLKDN